MTIRNGVLDRVRFVSVGHSRYSSSLLIKMWINLINSLLQFKVLQLICLKVTFWVSPVIRWLVLLLDFDYDLILIPSTSRFQSSENKRKTPLRTNQNAFGQMGSFLTSSLQSSVGGRFTPFCPVIYVYMPLLPLFITTLTPSIGRRTHSTNTERVGL